MTVPVVPTRPVGKSFFSELASTGAGLATGLAQEREKRRQTALEEALRGFQMEMGRGQLAVAERGASAQEAMRDIQRQQLEQNRVESEAQDRLRRDELRQQKELSYAEMQNRIRIAEIQARASAQRGQLDDTLAYLNGITMDVSRQIDDVRNDIGKMEAAQPMLLRYRIEPTKAKAEAKAKADNGDKSAADQYNMMLEYDRLKARQNDLLRQQSHYSRFRQSVGTGQGIPTPETTPTSPDQAQHWSELTPDEQIRRRSMLVEFIKGVIASKGAEPDYQSFLDFGVPSEIIEQARVEAGAAQTLGPQPMNTAATQQSGLLTPAVPRPAQALPQQAVPQQVMPQQPQAPGTVAPPALPVVNQPMPKSPEAVSLERARIQFGQGVPLSTILASEPNSRIRRMLADSLSTHRIQP